MVERKTLPSAVAFGKRLAQARRELGIVLERDVLQPELATLLGVAQATVNRWETGQRRPSRDETARIAAFFQANRVTHVTEAWLDYGERVRAEPPAISGLPQLQGGPVPDPDEAPAEDWTKRKA